MASGLQTQLGGWKAIAAYLQRDERTVMRWAAQRGMPVQRVPGQGRASVYASPEALDAWLRSGDFVNVADASPPPATPPLAPTVADPGGRRRRWRWLAVPSCVVLPAAAMLLVSTHRAAKPGEGHPVFTDPAAKALYLKATYDWNLRTNDSLIRAIQEYSAAIGRDPGVADSFVGLANCYLLLREYGSLADDQAYPRAEAAAKAALALAPPTVALRRVLAFVAFWWHGDRATARREFALALAQAPNDPLTHHWFANALSANGEHEAALREIDLARDLDPTSTSIINDTGLLTYLGGQRRLGLAMLQALARDQPQNVSVSRALADIALFEGRTSEYLDASERMARLRGDAAAEETARRLRTAVQANGPAPLATMLLAEARAKTSRSAGSFYDLARIASVAGRAVDADAALARACDLRESGVIGASGDLWLSRSLSPRRIVQLCGHATLVS